MKFETVQELSSIEGLELIVDAATVRILHTLEAKSIVVRANNPEHWKVSPESGLIEQIKSSDSSSGDMTIISGNGNVVMSGGNWLHIGGGVRVGGFSMGNVSMGSSRGKTVINSGGKSISIVNGDVFINGKKVDEPDSEQSEAAGEKTKDPDELEVIVPGSYAGDLSLDVRGVAEVTIDSWRCDTLYFSSSGCGNIKTGPLEASSFGFSCSGTSDLFSKGLKTRVAKVTISGTGDAQFESLVTDVLNVTVTGTGDCDIASGSATAGSFSATGTGDITARGNFQRLRQRCTGLGEINVR